MGHTSWESGQEARGHTQNVPSRGAWGDEHPIGPPWRGLPQPTETRVFLNSGPLEGPGSLWKLSQSECKPARDLISTTAEVHPEFYPGNLSMFGISLEILTLGKF